MAIVKRKYTTFKGKIFTVKNTDLIFPKGNRTHEYIDSIGRKSVIIIPVDKNGNVLLFEMYATAMHKRELFCPAGLIDKGETAIQAAKRECQEEVGYLPKKLIHLGTIETSPSYMIHTSELFLATDLTPSKLEGDEPEELKVLKTPWKKVHELIKKKKITYASAIAALLMAEKYLEKKK